MKNIFRTTMPAVTILKRFFIPNISPPRIEVPLFLSASKNPQQSCIGTTVEPGFNEVAGDWPNLFVKSRVRYMENLDITNLRGNYQNVRYIEVIVNN